MQLNNKSNKQVMIPEKALLLAKAIEMQDTDVVL